MAFPNTPLLDTFPVDQSPIGGSWTNKVYSTSNNARVTGGQFASVTGAGSAYWNPRYYYDPFEAYCTVPVVSTGLSIQFALTNPTTASRNSYHCFHGTTNFQVYRVDNDVETLLLQTNDTLSNGDQWGVSLINGLITVYKNGTSIGTWTDTKYHYGYLGLYCNDATTRLDDFGGGSLNPTTDTPYVPLGRGASW